jgi:putative intracellular protease/amidase
VLLPRANVRALAANSHGIPGAAPEFSNLNRAFTVPEAAAVDSRRPLTDLPFAGWEQSPAAAIWSEVVRACPDWLVDLHEDAGSDEESWRSPGRIGVSGTSATRVVAQAMLAAVNPTLEAGASEFVLAGPPRSGTLARAVRDQLRAQTLVVTTPARGPSLAQRIRQQRLMLHALLKHLGMIDSQVVVDRVAPRAEWPAMRLAVYAGPGTRNGMHHLLQELTPLPDASVIPLGVPEIAAGALSQFDAVLFPGGSSTRQGESLGAANRQRVQEFVERGGGYVGICAGAYLATTEFPWALQLLDARTHASAKHHGRGNVEIELTREGGRVLGNARVCCDVRYHNGPILVPAHRADLPDFRPWAFYRTGVAAEAESPEVMVDTPAIVAARYGKGRVACFSPHLDQTRGLEGLVRRAVLWSAGADRDDRYTRLDGAAPGRPAGSS